MEFDLSVDKSNLRQVILDFPKQFSEALDLCQDLVVDGDFDSVCIVGMGGSSMPGALLETLLGDDLTFPIYLSQGYILPSQVNKKTLIFCISYSGNTEETLAVYDQLRDLENTVVCIAAGGQLIKRAQRDGLPHVQVPSGLQPRFATGYQLTPMMVVLEKLNMIPAFSKDLRDLEQSLDVAVLEEQGKQLAEQLVGTTPVFYTSDRFGHIARIIKIKFNENAKTAAFWNVFPELNHNEMNGWMNTNGPFHVVIFRVPDDHDRVQRRMEITHGLIEEQGLKASLLDVEKKDSLLATVFTVLLLGDWASFYLSLAYKQDPTPVVMVESLKEQLKS